MLVSLKSCGQEGSPVGLASADLKKLVTDVDPFIVSSVKGKTNITKKLLISVWTFQLRLMYKTVVAVKEEEKNVCVPAKNHREDGARPVQVQLQSSPQVLQLTTSRTEEAAGVKTAERSDVQHVLWSCLVTLHSPLVSGLGLTAANNLEQQNISLERCIAGRVRAYV